jgi:uncharacterized membrane protein (DUF485 family)
MPKLKNRLALLVFIIATVVIAIIQYYFLSVKVHEVEPTTYSKHATDLQVTPAWRYGFAMGYHGATLIKTNNVPEAEPIHVQGGDNKVHEIMARELKLAPIKTISESVLYLVLLSLALFAPHWLAAKLLRRRRSYLGNRLIVFFVAITGWTIAIFPLLFFNYGTSVYTTWVGPGALSYSGPYYNVSFEQGDTISYRSFVDAPALYPAVLTLAVMKLGHYFPHLTVKMFLWIAGSWFYGVIGLLMGTARFLVEAGHKPAANTDSVVGTQ